MLSSALQVVNENAKLFGGTVLQASLDNADASSQLVESMGGMDEYLSKTGKYFSNFYSDVEQSQAKAGLSLQQITAVLHNVGLSVPMTAEGFKELVGSLDITTENGRDAYAALMSVADAADAVYKNSKRIADDTNDLYRDLTSRRLSAEGNTYAATMYDVLVKQQKERLEVEAKGLKDTTLYTDLLAVQQLEYASAAKEAAKSTSELSKSLGALVDDQTKILETMRNIMTGGSQLSPEAAYQAAQQNFAAVTSATVPDASAISSAATALLDASKNYNASGVAYQNDVQNVLTTLGQMVDTAPTIDAVTKQVDILNQIKQSIDTGNLTQLQSLLSILDQNTKIAKGISDFLGTIPSSAGGTGTSSTGSLPPVNTRSTDWASTAATMLTNNLTQTVPVYIAQKFIPPGSSKIAQNAINAVIPQGSTTFLKPIDTPIGMEQYDVAPPYGTLDQADIDLLKKMASGGAALPTYAVGSAYLQTDQFAQVHQGESIIDARSNEVLQKYGIRVQTISSSGNKDEEIALLKEQNAHLAAMVRLLQAFASKSIELDEKQLKQLGTMVSKTRLENAA
jgi:hypothetical protein